MSYRADPTNLADVAWRAGLQHARQRIATPDVTDGTPAPSSASSTRETPPWRSSNVLGSSCTTIGRTPRRRRWPSCCSQSRSVDGVMTISAVLRARSASPARPARWRAVMVGRRARWPALRAHGQTGDRHDRAGSDMPLGPGASSATVSSRCRSRKPAMLAAMVTAYSSVELSSCQRVRLCRGRARSPHQSWGRDRTL